MMNSEWLISFLASTVRLSIPILLAGLGGVFTSRSGITNIGIEGTMLFGTLAGVLGSYYFSNPTMGAFFAVMIGGIIGILFAYLVVSIGADQIIMGMAINLLALGLTTTVFRTIFGVSTMPPKVEMFNVVKIPIFGDIPYLGYAFFQHSPLVYLSYALVPVSSYLLFKTVIGLRIRSVGENPKATDTVGIDVVKIRYGTCIVGGMLAGLAGAYISISQLNMFTENMTAGKGFVALAAIIFGKWSPVGVLFAALLFGAGDALQLRFQLQSTGIPYQFLLALPYILTVFVLAGFGTKAIPPASTGKAYKREQVI